MSNQIKRLTPEQHLAMIGMMKARLKKNLVFGQWSQSFKKEELESLITACTLAELHLNEAIARKSHEENPPATTETTDVLP